jgi:tRNA pseudouridine38-40 synthase
MSEDSKESSLRNLKVVLAYDGYDFSGWQVQPELETIQGSLASAIGRLTGEKVLPQGSGRTDAGVHALAQVASFTTGSSIPVENWQKALNDILPASIRVLDVQEVGTDFHARKSARKKTYRYRIYRAGVCPPFLAGYVWHFPYPLDEEAMAQAAALVVGEHDFTSFAAVDEEKRDAEIVTVNAQNGLESGKKVAVDECKRTTAASTNVRTIFSSTWVREGDEFTYTVSGSGFLHHMVRNLVGTFLLVGKGTLRVQDIGTILEARNRSAAGATAPASGLYLVSVEY